MHTALLITRKDLRQRLRDRSALILGFAAPLVIATLMSFAFSGSEDLHVDLAVADADRGPVAAALTDLLTGDDLDGLVTVTAVDSDAAARHAVEDGTADAALVVPAGFSDVTHGGPAVDLTVLTSVNAELAGQVTTSIADSFTAQLDANLLSLQAALAAGGPPEDLPALAGAAAATQIPVHLDQQPPGTKEMAVISYYGPSMAIFFVFFAISFGAKAYFEEVSGGTLSRVASAPVRPGAVLLGKALSTFVYAVASLTTMALVTTLAFGADWGPFWAAATLVGSIAVVVVALTALVITLSGNERQADGIASLVIFGLVLLGGNFVYVWAAPQTLQTVALFTPNGWVMRAFTDMASGADAADVVLAPVLVCLGFAAVTGGFALAMSRRAVLR
jgi:ABC-2 type transport system permease protein